MTLPRMMLERMAAAMWDEQEAYLGTRLPWKDAHPEAGQGVMIRLLRAALQAARVPDEAMVQAARAVQPYDAPAEEMWPAMIDAILTKWV